MADAAKCPGCGVAVGAGDLICVRCGVNLKTGMKLRPDAAETEPSEEELREPSRFLVFVSDYLPGLVSAQPAIGAAVVGLPGLAIFALGMWSMKGFGGAGAYVAMGGLVLYAQALAFLIHGELAMLYTAFIDFSGTKWFTFFVLVSLPPCIALAVGKGMFKETDEFSRRLPWQRVVGDGADMSCGRHACASASPAAAGLRQVQQKRNGATPMSAVLNTQVVSTVTAVASPSGPGTVPRGQGMRARTFPHTA